MPLSLIPRSFWDEDDLLSFPSTPSGVSVSEDDKHIYVQVALPGVEEKNIEVTFDKGMLWVNGEVEETEEDKKRKYYRHSSGSFAYQVAVPGDLDLAVEPDATFKNGVMTVKFTKTPKSQPKKIAVKASK